MKEEYNFTLTLPLTDIEEALGILTEAQRQNPMMRLRRKPDRNGTARFYLSFPFHGQRDDLRFKEWFDMKNLKAWELFGPQYGVWGFT